MSLQLTCVGRLSAPAAPWFSLVTFRRADDAEISDSTGDELPNPEVPREFVVQLGREHSLTFQIGETYTFEDLRAPGEEEAAKAPKGKKKRK